METVSTNISHGGTQGVYTHQSSTCNCEMKFSVFVPPQAKDAPCPVLYYLSGLTCTHANVTEKGEFRAAAAENPDARWQDEAWWLLWPMLLIVLFWFRRGWVLA